jgi:TetR/AcrR family transcriptional regulator, mexJK operon transcriptional repressor
LLQVAAEHFARHGYRATTMSQIAAAANLTKMTLYSWHGDKAALFRACLTEGAQRFPLPDLDLSKDPESALRHYAAALLRELTSEYMLGFALLLLREGQDFPELGAAVDRSVRQFQEEPLVRYFGTHGMAAEEARERATLFLALALAPLHNHLLLTRPLPSGLAIDEHAARVVSLFLTGSVLRESSGRSST